MLPSLYAWQKTIHFDRLSVEDGLPGTFVRSIIMDKVGFMWFATNNGLARYDGYDFVVYQHDPDDPDTVSSNETLSVFEDHQGVLWVGTDAGLDRFDREQETFTHFVHDPEDAASLGGPVVPTIYEDSQGVLWIGHWFAGLSKFDRASGTFVRYQHDPDVATSLPLGNVFAILEDRSGNFWVGTNGREGSPDLTRLDRDTGTFNRFFACQGEKPECPQRVDGSSPPASSSVRSIYEDKAGIIWISGQGLTRYDPASNTYKQYQNEPDNPKSLAGKSLTRNFVQDDDGALWFPDNWNGLIGFDPETETFSNHHHDPTNPTSIGEDTLWTIYRDRSGVIWIGGYWNGISKFDPRSLAFGHYQHDPGDPDSISSTQNLSYIVEGQNNQLWIAFRDNGLNKVERQSGTVTAYRNDPDNPKSLESNNVYALHIAQTGDLWVGSLHGLSRFDSETGVFEYFPSVTAGEAAISIAEDQDGLLWLTTTSALHQYDPATGTTVSYRANADEPGALHGDAFYIQLIADDGNVWISSQSGGINVFDPATANVAHYVHDPQNPDSLPQGPTQTVRQDQQGVIWVGTQNGLRQLDPESGVFRPLEVDVSLPRGRISNIISVSQGNLWLLTSTEGLWKINPATGTSRQYGKSDGFIGGSLEPGFLSHTGELVMADETGIFIFDPAKLPDRPQDPVVALTDFLLMNESVSVTNDKQKTPLKKPISENPAITLTHKDYLFEFDFAALDYVDPKNIRYAYMLEGFDREWIETTANKRFATYTNMPAGSYTLWVKARRSNAGWSPHTASVWLTILPPWWQTRWAYGLYILAFALGLFAYIRWRTIKLTRQTRLLEKAVKERTAKIEEHERQIQHQAEELQELLHQKDRLITNISHEFRTPLTLIQGPADRLLQSNENQQGQSLLTMIRRNSRRLLRLVDQLLGLAHLGTEEPLPRSPQPLLSVTSTITESFKTLAEAKGLQLSMDPGDEIWVNCSPDALDKILLNLLSNAIKFTPAGGHVNVSVHPCDDGFAELKVTDTGVGIPEEKQQAVFERFTRVADNGEAVPGAGIGLALVKELVEAYDGKVLLDSQPGKGSTFTVRLPGCELAGEQVNTGHARVNREAVELEIESLSGPDPAILPETDHDTDGKASILIVEDNTDMQRYLANLLSDTYDCELSADGQQAVEMAFENIPDLVLLDVMLPGKDGFQVSHVLKEDERTSHIPIVMLTARADIESRMEGLQEKVDDYLAKPFDARELKLRIANLLEIRNILKRRFSSRYFEESESDEHLDEKENGFLERLEGVLENNHDDTEFDLTQMADQMHMSTRQLQRKLKAITGHNPAEYLRSYRLKRARALLRAGTHVGLVADSVGFSSPAYFTSCFKAQFAMTPSEFKQQFQ